VSLRESLIMVVGDPIPTAEPVFVLEHQLINAAGAHVLRLPADRAAITAGHPSW
jgi:hypothetical protein